ncbi:MAG: hypothetical protein Q4C12_00840 [Clostridia bacterium]|nr:hypothetical protein [Clostridia bacterium]
MKKLICSAMTLVIVLSFSACAGTKKERSENEYDVDLTALSSTMVYAEVYNMMAAPEDYIGKSVKMRGEFSLYQDPETNQLYFALIIEDATACCAQGLEFVLAGDYSYPEDYPELGAEITVAGKFQTYEENGELYCHLVDAEILQRTSSPQKSARKETAQPKRAVSKGTETVLLPPCIVCTAILFFSAAYNHRKHSIRPHRSLANSAKA